MTKNWGYQISQTRKINLDEVDLTIAQKILDMEPTFRLCISCGGCTATCTAGSFTDFNIRRVNLMIRRGQLDGLYEQLNHCMLCGKCHLVCPHGVNTRKVILLMKQLLSEYESHRQINKEEKNV
ncbi:MAG: 4Fe-4S dicluster domain-containing protein [Bacteroidales bacterium]|nr:4Fe-4S dicluster domain-containing protein [Bacteroidales bacterium]